MWMPRKQKNGPGGCTRDKTFYTKRIGRHTKHTKKILMPNAVCVTNAEFFVMYALSKAKDAISTIVPVQHAHLKRPKGGVMRLWLRLIDLASYCKDRVLQYPRNEDSQF